MSHFVVLKSATRSKVEIHDPASGARRLAMSEASKHLSGVALELFPSEGFSRTDERVRLPFKAFWRGIDGSTHAVVQIVALSAAIEILLLAAPFYMQLAVDEVVARGDVDLLLTLALGFALLMTIQVAAEALRSLVVLVLQNTLHFHIGSRLFRHLVRLPLGYFEKRQIGDVLSRFSSIEPIRKLLAEDMITAMADGLMAMATLAIIFLYSALLAGIVIGAAGSYLVLRLIFFRQFWDRNQSVLHTKAQESSIFIETLRAMQSVKIFNRENEREMVWVNRYADVVAANVRLERAKIAFKTLNHAIFGVENILSVYIAARLALDGALTIGMIFAFMSYKRSFIEKSAQLVEKAMDFRIIGLHMERLGDIALSQLERGHDNILTFRREARGRIELRNVCYRYAESEPFVLENVNLAIEPGEFVTITGPSGGGKTTLMKIMLGLLEPTSGEVAIDGTALSAMGARAYRESVGAVMQEDQLLSGSIADNICFFDSSLDFEWMIECAKLAGVHDEIMRMPMGYNSLIGDMGSSLSGGQKQRVLLARALYRRPKFLFLDEGTAHLDIEKEKEINNSLKQLSMTRISIAHRHAIAGGADRIMRLDRNSVVENLTLGRDDAVVEHQSADGPMAAA